MGETEEKIYKIDDIAKELGVSKTTVSRAISGKGRISKATRERVHAFIEQHNYRPNVLAKGLAQNKTYNLAMVLPMDYAAEEVPFFRECMNGICEMASSYSYDIMIAMSVGQDLRQIQRLILDRKVDGMIISRATVASGIQKFLKEKKMPFVVVGPSDDPDVIWVDNHNQEASKELTELMLMKGIRKLALFGGDCTYLVTESRLQGFLQAHQEQGEMPDETLVFMGIDNYLKAAKAVEKTLEAGADGILCMDDFITTLVLGCLREKGIHVPSDIKLASLYDSIQLEQNTPAVTSLRFDTRELGRHACISLLQLLGEEIGEERMPLNYQVILRESTK